MESFNAKPAVIMRNSIISECFALMLIIRLEIYLYSLCIECWSSEVSDAPARHERRWNKLPLVYIHELYEVKCAKFTWVGKFSFRLRNLLKLCKVHCWPSVYHTNKTTQCTLFRKCVYKLCSVHMKHPQATTYFIFSQIPIGRYLILCQKFISIKFQRELKLFIYHKHT